MTAQDDGPVLFIANKMRSVVTRFVLGILLLSWMAFVISSGAASVADWIGQRIGNFHTAPIGEIAAVAVIFGIVALPFLKGSYSDVSSLLAAIVGSGIFILIALLMIAIFLQGLFAFVATQLSRPLETFGHIYLIGKSLSKIGFGIWLMLVALHLGIVLSPEYRRPLDEIFSDLFRSIRKELGAEVFELAVEKLSSIISMNPRH